MKHLTFRLYYAPFADPALLTSDFLLILHTDPVIHLNCGLFSSVSTSHFLLYWPQISYLYWPNKSCNKCCLFSSICASHFLVSWPQISYLYLYWPSNLNYGLFSSTSDFLLYWPQISYLYMYCHGSVIYSLESINKLWGLENL